MIDALFSSWFSPFSFFACCRNAGSVRHQRCGNILFIVYVAFIFLLCNQHGRIGETLTSWIVGLELSRLEFFLALVLLFTVLGCLIEGLGMIVITVPLLYQIGHRSALVSASCWCCSSRCDRFRRHSASTSSSFRTSRCQARRCRRVAEDHASLV